MSAIRMLFCLLGTAVFFSPALIAQVQLNPYVFQWRPHAELQIISGEDQADRSLGLGIEALIGPNQLSPLVGLAYQKRQYRLFESGGFEQDEFQLQLGLAYRLRAASTSFNLVPHLALSPTAVLSASQDSNLPEFVLERLEENIHWRLRSGLTLYLDFISLHYNWLFHLSKDVDEKSYRHLGLGVRF